MRNFVRGSRLPLVTDPTSTDPTKSYATIALKGFGKTVLAVCGVPAGGEIVDLVAEIVLKHLAKPNDLAAETKFKELQAGIESTVSAHPEKYKGGRSPSSDDVEQGLIRFAKAYKKAGSHDKRWVFYNAFHNSFRPEFYNAGMAQILWPKVEALEYPDLEFLQKLLTDPKTHAILETRHVLNYEFARRLEAQGLVSIEEVGFPRVRIEPREIARLLQRFTLEVLDDYWKDDDRAASE